MQDFLWVPCLLAVVMLTAPPIVHSYFARRSRNKEGFIFGFLTALGPSLLGLVLYAKDPCTRGGPGSGYAHCEWVGQAYCLFIAVTVLSLAIFPFAGTIINAMIRKRKAGGETPGDPQRAQPGGRK